MMYTLLSMGGRKLRNTCKFVICIISSSIITNSEFDDVSKLFCGIRQMLWYIYILVNYTLCSN